MEQNTHHDLTKQAVRSLAGRLTALLVASLLLLVTGLIYKNYQQRYTDFVALQQRLMVKSAEDTIQALNLYIRQIKQNVDLFAAEKQDLILHLARSPDDESVYEQLHQQISRYLPDYFAFTITDSSGELLIDDFGGDIGDACRQDISNFAKTGHPGTLVIHPNPLQYHFDVMADIRTDEKSGIIFFVSFKPQVLSNLLALSEIGSHQIMLLNKTQPRLIELSSQGTRSELQRDIYLTEAEYESIHVWYDVPGSQWQLVYLPDNALYQRRLQRYRAQVLEIFVIVFVFSIGIIILILREARKRQRAERALQESNARLESRVARRTEALSRLNEKLQQEIRQRKRIEKQLQHDALHDVLTGLPNRNLFLNHLDKAVRSRLRDKQFQYAVMFIDLDDFKHINDTMGHAAGDELLKTVADRLLSCLRPGDTLARFGGDEFVALIINFNELADISRMAVRMNETVAEKMTIQQQTLIIQASTGIAIGTENYLDSARILRDADAAMYHAKNLGSGKYCIFGA